MRYSIVRALIDNLKLLYLFSLTIDKDFKK